MSSPASTSPARRPSAQPRKVYPSDLLRSAQRRTQREEARKKAREEGDRRQLTLDLANALDEVGRRPEFRDALPELVARVNQLALSIRVRGNATPDRDADAILYAISKQALPARLLSEIVTDTGLLKDEVKESLERMITCGMVRKLKTEVGTEYWPTGTKRHPDILP